MKVYPDTGNIVFIVKASVLSEAFLLSAESGIIWVMGKVLTHYVCQECGRTSPKFMGRCPGCGAFGTMVEEIKAEQEDPSGQDTGALFKVEF